MNDGVGSSSPAPPQTTRSLFLSRDQPSHIRGGEHPLPTVPHVSETNIATPDGAAHSSCVGSHNMTGSRLHQPTRHSTIVLIAVAAITLGASDSPSTRHVLHNFPLSLSLRAVLTISRSSPIYSPRLTDYRTCCRRPHRHPPRRHLPHHGARHVVLYNFPLSCHSGGCAKNVTKLANMHIGRLLCTRLVNQEARATTGCFRTTNLGALSMESGLSAATTQLENRQRRLGLRLLSLPKGDQVGEIVGTLLQLDGGLRTPPPTPGGRRPQFYLRSRRPQTQNRSRGRRRRPRLRQRRPGPDLSCSRTCRGLTTELPVTRWCEERPILGGYQGPHGIQLGGLRCGVCCPRKGTGSRSSLTPKLPSDRWLQRSRAWTNSTCSRPGSTSLRCAAEGSARHRLRDPMVPGPQRRRWQRKKADEWARIAAEEPETRGVEWLRYSDRAEARAMPPPRCLANIRRTVSEKKWAGAPVGWGQDLQGEIPDAEKPKAGRCGGWEHQEACLAVLPD